MIEQMTDEKLMFFIKKLLALYREFNVVSFKKRYEKQSR
jgi:hypothetical protein